MFNIEKDDMDDLFREAADKYQVDSRAAFDWDKINKALHESDDQKVLTIQQLNTSGKNKRKYLLLFLFIFLMIGGSFFYYNKMENPVSVNASVNPKANNSVHVFSKNNEQKIHKNQQRNNISQIQPGIKSFTKTTILSQDLLKDESKRPARFYFEKKSAKDSKDNNTLLTDDLNELKSLNNSNNLPGTSAPKAEKKMNMNVEKEPSDFQLKTKEGKKDSAVNKKIITAKRFSGFYAGIVASPEFTFIKSQKSEPGFTFGAIGGFNINEQWSIETGFLFNKKNYYSKGEYFNKSKIAYLNNLNLISVEGNCNMFEIPLSVRYRFAKKNKSNWSASLGTSTYLMQKEQYGYSFTNYGTNGYGQQSYYHSSNNLFATVNVDLGYERKINNSVALRIEPYLKLSVKGVGIGSLPMSAAGVNVGVSVPLH
ncbi:MAG: porin family protein [Ginsengibacter sp.]